MSTTPADLDPAEATQRHIESVGAPLDFDQHLLVVVRQSRRQRFAALLHAHLAGLAREDGHFLGGDDFKVGVVIVTLVVGARLFEDAAEHELADHVGHFFLLL